MGCYSDDLFAYDVVPPRQYAGAAAFQKPWQGLIGMFKGPINVARKRCQDPFPFSCVAAGASKRFLNTFLLSPPFFSRFAERDDDGRKCVSTVASELSSIAPFECTSR